MIAALAWFLAATTTIATVATPRAWFAAADRSKFATQLACLAVIGWLWTITNAEDFTAGNDSYAITFLVHYWLLLHILPDVKSGADTWREYISKRDTAAQDAALEVPEDTGPGEHRMEYIKEARMRYMKAGPRYGREPQQ